MSHESQAEKRARERQRLREATDGEGPETLAGRLGRRIKAALRAATP